MKTPGQKKAVKQQAQRQAQPESQVATADGKILRVDGLEARTRLLDAALQLFAERGYAKTSTREIAKAANVNISAISYYFSDKAGLYRAVFNDPRTNPNVDPAIFEQEDADLRSTLLALICTFTDSMKQGELMETCMKLHFREMLEPTGLWMEEIDTAIKPSHLAMVKFLCRYLGISKADDDVHRLAISISGLAISLLISGDVIQAIRPALIAKPKAIDVYASRLVDFAIAMCDDEKRRRLAVKT
ncbi:TetR family transcriptional regulator [Undibacterium pigrum]|uniref:TetR family transcriptional regulator n=1 Tax=Undibacterium pigrum TaxID=401470 RepID=A0A318JJQ1_9BURK|nr:TetR family transcriptional regulator [Undibacterium pigrum]